MCTNSEIGIIRSNQQLILFIPKSEFPLPASLYPIPFPGLGSNIGHGLFVGWVEHPYIFVGFLRLRRTNLRASHFCAISETQQNGRR